MKHWYAVRTATRQERKAAEAMTEAGLEVYVPLERRLTRLPCKTGETTVQAPLIKGWIFARGTLEEMLDAKHFEGVSSVASFRDENGDMIPAPLNAQDRALLSILRELEAKGEFDHANRPRYTPGPGEAVKVTKGPFGGYIGKALETIAETRRTRVELKSGRLEISTDHLEAVA